MTDSNVVTPTEAVAAPVESRKYAGKYNTVEELEEGYKESLKVHLENKELKTKYDELTQVPESYQIPEGLSLRAEEIDQIQSISKDSGLTQAQFERTAKAMQSRLQSQREAFDKARESIGNEKLILLEDYVKKAYPESLQDVILSHLIKDQKAMDDAMKARDKLLDTRAPGMEGSGNRDVQSGYDGHKEMAKAAEEFHRNPTPQNRQRYINLASEVGNERFVKGTGR